MRGHEDGVLCRNARGHGLADHPVDVPGVGDVLRVAVVGAERDAPRPVLLDERQERAQVASHRGLADEEPHPRAQSLAALLDRERLVVRVDAGCRVGLKLGAEDARRVPVDVFRTLEAELLELGRRAGDDAGKVHHLRESEDPSAPHQ
jgi:hypothetical protein